VRRLRRARRWQELAVARAPRTRPSPNALARPAECSARDWPQTLRSTAGGGLRLPSVPPARAPAGSVRCVGSHGASSRWTCRPHGTVRRRWEPRSSWARLLGDDRGHGRRRSRRRSVSRSRVTHPNLAVAAAERRVVVRWTSTTGRTRHTMTSTTWAS
jgi:hypothetical protein